MKLKSQYLHLSASLLAIFTLGLAAPGCSDETSPVDDGAGGGGPWADGPLYVGSTRVFNAEGSVGYLYRTKSLDEGTEIDLGEAIEMDDAWVFGDADPYFYTATIFSPLITQWSLDENGDFVEGPTISFANDGVGGTYTAAFVPLWKKDKAYFVDGSSGQVVIWNPEAMEFIGTIEVDVELPEDHDGPADLSPNVELAVTEDRILVSVSWASMDSGWTELGSYSRLIVIDPNTDTVVSSTDEPRCESLSPAGTTTEGTTYYAPWDYLAAVRGVYGPGYGSASCGLRAVAGESTYDEGYDVDLRSLVGDRPAGSAFLVDDQTLLLHVWDEALVEATPENWVEETRWLSGYEWYRWTIGTDTAARLPNQEPSAEGGTWTKLDGKLLTYTPNAEYSETTLLWLDDDGTLASGATIPGWTVATIRAR